MGLSATEHFNGYPLAPQDLLNAVADLDLDVIATIADNQRTHLNHIPPNTRIVPYVPLHALAPTLTAAIHHAGAATLATISRHGIPQLAIHHHYDQPLLAHLLATQGTAIALPATHATTTTIRDNLHQLLNNPTHRTAAHHLRDEIHTAPTPNDLVPHLEQLTTKHRTT
jgi:UDP:flavonoid glycosyltransferase YjiC (YdhE family)